MNKGLQILLGATCIVVIAAATYEVGIPAYHRNFPHQLTAAEKTLNLTKEIQNHLAEKRRERQRAAGQAEDP